MKNIANRIVMILTGAVLIVASFLKVHMMTTEPVVGQHFWQSWVFFLVQVPLVLGLGIWLVSGLFRKAGWILGVSALVVFLGDTIYKAVTGAESCGCFGTVEVDPWITLFAFNLPFLLLMLIFRPRGEKLFAWPPPDHFIGIAVVTALLLPAVVGFMVVHKVEPVRIGDVGISITDGAVQTTGQIDKPKPLQIPDNSDQAQKPEPIGPETNDDAQGTSQTQPDETDATEPGLVSETTYRAQSEDKDAQPVPRETTPETQQENIRESEPPDQTQESWEQESIQGETGPAATEDEEPEPAAETAKDWELLQYIDIADTLHEGMAVTLLFHTNCPTCRDVIPQYERAIEQFGELPITVAYVEIPPYGDPEDSPIPEGAYGIYGQLAELGVDDKGRKRKWYIGTPLVVVTQDGERIAGWPQGEAPGFDELLDTVFSQ